MLKPIRPRRLGKTSHGTAHASRMVSCRWNRDDDLCLWDLMMELGTFDHLEGNEEGHEQASEQVYTSHSLVSYQQDNGLECLMRDEEKECNIRY